MNNYRIFLKSFDQKSQIRSKYQNWWKILKRRTINLSPRLCSWSDLVHQESEKIFKNLKNFNCSYSEGLRGVNVSGCKKFRAIRCNHSGLKKLNVKKNTNLRLLLCKQTDIKKLNLSNTRIRKASALKCDPDVTVTYAKWLFWRGHAWSDSVRRL